MATRVEGLVLRWSCVGLLLLGSIGAAVLFYPLQVKLDRVQTQSTMALPASLRQALRYSLSEDGSDSAIRYEAARILAGSMPGHCKNLGLWPLLISVRLQLHSKVTQSERFVLKTHLARCWKANLEDLTMGDALYLAARTRSPATDNPDFIQSGMARVGQRMVAAGALSTAELEVILAAPAPVCH
jgi:hypothetical protein